MAWRRKSYLAMNKPQPPTAAPEAIDYGVADNPSVECRWDNAEGRPRYVTFTCSLEPGADGRYVINATPRFGLFKPPPDFAQLLHVTAASAGEALEKCVDALERSVGPLRYARGLGPEI